jgi:hypothetical protein
VAKLGKPLGTQSRAVRHTSVSQYAMRVARPRQCPLQQLYFPVYLEQISSVRCSTNTRPQYAVVPLVTAWCCQVWTFMLSAVEYLQLSYNWGLLCSSHGPDARNRHAIDIAPSSLGPSWDGCSIDSNAAVSCHEPDGLSWPQKTSNAPRWTLPRGSDQRTWSCTPQMLHMTPT